MFRHRKDKLKFIKDHGHIDNHDEHSAVYKCTVCGADHEGDAELALDCCYDDCVEDIRAMTRSFLHDNWRD